MPNDSRWQNAELEDPSAFCIPYTRETPRPKNGATQVRKHTGQPSGGAVHARAPSLSEGLQSLRPSSFHSEGQKRACYAGSCCPTLSSLAGHEKLECCSENNGSKGERQSLKVAPDPNAC